MRSLATLPDADLADVVGAVWYETAPARARLHRLLRSPSCDVAVVAGATVIGRLRLAGECPCRDLLVDVLVEADRFLAEHGAELRNLAGAVRVHTRTRALVECSRRRRVERGAQARTDRIRTSARARALPDEFHRALLEYLVAEAGSVAPLGDEAHLHARLADLAAAEFGGCPDDWRGRIVAALPTVEAACRRGPTVPAGPGRLGENLTWWERYVEEPLGRRPPPDMLPLDALTTDVPLAPRHSTPMSDPATGGRDEIVVAVLAVARSAAGDPRPGDRAAQLTAALRTVTADLVVRRVLPGPVASEFVADAERVQEAVNQMLALIAA